MLQINVANLPCEETTVSCRIVQTAVSDVAGMSMYDVAWHGNVSSHLVTVRMWPVLYVRDVSRRPNMFARVALDRQCGGSAGRGRGSTHYGIARHDVSAPPSSALSLTAHTHLTHMFTCTAETEPQPDPKFRFDGSTAARA